MSPPNNVNFLEIEEGEFDLSNLIVLEGETVRSYKILKVREICIIGGEEEVWIEDRVDELEFEQNLAKEVVTIEWWDPTIAADDSI